MTQKFCQTCGGKVTVREDGAIVHQPAPKPPKPEKPRFEVVEDFSRGRIIIYDSLRKAILAVNKSDFIKENTPTLKAIGYRDLCRKHTPPGFFGCTRSAGHDGPCAHEAKPYHIDRFYEVDPVDR